MRRRAAVLLLLAARASSRNCTIDDVRHEDGHGFDFDGCVRVDLAGAHLGYQRGQHDEEFGRLLAALTDDVEVLDLRANYLGNRGCAAARAMTARAPPPPPHNARATLTARRAKELAHWLRTARVTDLEVSHNYIGPPGGRALAEAFEANRKFTRLHLGANRFRDEGAIALAGAVRANTALRNLTLSFNGVKAKGAAALAAVLANNGSSLRALELDQNPLGDKGVIALGDALATNAVVEYVDVHATGMGDAGAAALAAALGAGSSILDLQAWNNSIGDAGAVAIAGALEANTRLWVLSLEQNSIGEKGALALARAITVGARNIFELGLSLNPIPEKGARKLMAVLDDRATALRRLALPRNGREGLHAPSWECVGGCPQGHQSAVLDPRFWSDDNPAASPTPQREADRVNEPAWPSWYVPGTSLLGEIQSGPDPDDPSGYQRRRYQDEL